MKIGIIGSGNIGGALTRRFRAVGHDVTVANSRGPASLAELAQETGAHAGTLAEAVAGQELVVVAIPLIRIPDVAPLFAGAGAALIVVDTSNYYPRHRDGRIAAVEEGMTESGWVAQQLGRPVVKAFNMIYAQRLQDDGKPAGEPGRIAIAVAGDDLAAKEVVMHLIDQIGFDAVDAGSLAESWRQQPGSPVYTQASDAGAVREALAQASPQRSADWRATPNSPGSFDSPA